jgi:hypothetical protein
LFKPAPEYIKKVFNAAHKPRAYIPLIQGYMHAAAADSDFAKHLFEVVFKGLNDNDYDNIRQYLILFESLLLA